MSLNPRIDTWAGRTVWLIGASSGIGLAAASALHAKGCRVIVSARNAAALEAFVRAHPGSLALPLDATDATQVQGAAQQLALQGRLDMVCYCAGYFRAMRATDIDLPDAMRHLDINLRGAWHVIAAVAPALCQQRSGHISLIGSVAGLRGLPESLAYGPTKAALSNLADALHLDLRPLGIGVSLVTPGFVSTPLTAGNDFPMPALMTPEQAAQAMIRGWERGGFCIHFPKRFTRVVRLLSMLPDWLYFRLVHRATGL